MPRRAAPSLFRRRSAKRRAVREKIPLSQRPGSLHSNDPEDPKSHQDVRDRQLALRLVQDAPEQKKRIRSLAIPPASYQESKHAAEQRSLPKPYVRYGRSTASPGPPANATAGFYRRHCARQARRGSLPAINSADQKANLPSQTDR